MSWETHGEFCWFDVTCCLNVSLISSPSSIQLFYILKLSYSMVFATANFGTLPDWQIHQHAVGVWTISHTLEATFCFCYWTPRRKASANPLSKAHNSVVGRYHETTSSRVCSFFFYPSGYTNLPILPTYFTYCTVTVFNIRLTAALESRAVNDSCSLKYLFWGHFPPGKRTKA